MDDQTLLRKARALDKEALGLIYDQHYQSVYRYVSFRVGDAQTAEDLAAEVFTRFLAALRGRGALPNTIAGWLFGTAQNVLREHYRKQKQMNWSELDDAIAGPDRSPEQRLQERFDSEALRAALAELTPEQQHVLALRFGQGLPIKAVAELIGKSEGAVKMLQLRAIGALAGRLTAQGASR